MILPKPIRITTKGQLPNLSNDDKVVIENVTGDKAANVTFKIGNVSRNTFDLLDVAQPGGTYS